MKNPTDLENALYQNAVMGASSIKKVYPNVKDKKLKDELKSQYGEYKKQTDMITSQLKSKNVKPDGIPIVSKVVANADIKLNCLMDDSTGNLAKMMIQGTNMGIIKVTQALNDAKGDSSRTVSEAKSILSKEQKYIDKLKGFL